MYKSQYNSHLINGSFEEYIYRQENNCIYQIPSEETPQGSAQQTACPNTQLKRSLPKRQPTTAQHHKLKKCSSRIQSIINNHSKKFHTIIVLLFYKFNPIARDSSTCDNEERTNSLLCRETLLTFSNHTPLRHCHPSPQTPPGIGDCKGQTRNQRMQGNLTKVLNIVMNYFICAFCLQANTFNSIC